MAIDDADRFIEEVLDETAQVSASGNDVRWRVSVAWVTHDDLCYVWRRTFRGEKPSVTMKELGYVSVSTSTFAARFRLANWIECVQVREEE